MKKKLGIIGFGAFGRFMAKYLEDFFSILHFDPKLSSSSNLSEVCKSDYLVLAVPVQALEETLINIKDLILEKTLVIDVCSIKCFPLELLNKHLPPHIEFLCTHPLFGPKSGANGIKGLNIAICEGRVSNNKREAVINFLSNKLGLNVIETNAKEHDFQMAYVQGLTHFIAKGFSQMELPELLLTTASYEHFAKIKDIVSLDSPELYKVIQDLNPYTKDVREEFLSKLSQLNLS